MATLRLADELGSDFARIAAHLRTHDAADVRGRLDDIVDALQVLMRHPLIGRGVAGGRRELVIGRDSRGYVALYRYDELDDEVVVLALRGQREAGFGE